MSFNFQGFIFNQFVLLFLTIGLGNLFGKLKIKSFSFGLTGSLFVGLVIGAFLTLYASGVEGSDRALEIIQSQIVNGNITSMALMIFITATGLMASKSVGYAIKNFGKQFLVLAVLIPFVGFATTVIGGKISGLNVDQVNGSYVGALTSSAGLGSALDSAGQSSARMTEGYEQLPDAGKEHVLNIINTVNQRNADLTGSNYEEKTLSNSPTITDEEASLYTNERDANIGIGYSISYPFGVLAVIIGVNLIPVLAGINVEKEKELYFAQKKSLSKNTEDNEEAPVFFDFAAFSLTAFLGYLLGQITINLGPLGEFSLGNVGGGVIVGLILGSLGKVGPLNFTMNSKFLNSFRNYFLSLFLAGTGLNYGYVVYDALTGSGIQIVIVAFTIAAVSIVAGFIVGRYLFKMNWVMLSGAITGGMTSAPGMGAAIEAVGHEDASIGYAATQPIATLCMVFFSLLLYYI